MIPLRNISTVAMATVGLTSSCTYCVQAVVQIRRHGFKTWLEAGFNQLERVVEDVEEAAEVEEEVL